ncbi:hypothetical protein QAD02_005311 [Eretmocerus hayati]|uniref:Uncharacterized protein n=1 Tax=Eretmocerus hayati TaxID=131215 RepID=A0ACC2NS16_9HYME|nr:hypothetical protein QAD02_005311 [Eretmocerus hayati]
MLHVACKSDCYDMVKSLIERGAEVNASDDWGTTLFLEAASSANIDIIRILLENDADPEATDYMERNALHYLCHFSREDDPAVAGVLLDLELQVNALDRVRDSPLHLAIRSFKRKLPFFFIEEGANVDARNLEGETPLMGAVEYQSHHFTKYLIEKGARVDETRNDNLSALHIAYNRRQELQIETLLARRAKLDPDPGYIIPFFYSCPVLVPESYWIIREMVRLEMTGGHVSLVDTDLIFSEGESTLQFAQFHEEVEKMRDLKFGQNRTLLDIFEKPEEFAANIMRDKRIIRKIEAIDVEVEYPNFYKILASKLVSSLELREFHETCEKKLIQTFRNVSPIPVIERIVYFL